MCVTEVSYFCGHVLREEHKSHDCASACSTIIQLAMGDNCKACEDQTISADIFETSSQRSPRLEPSMIVYLEELVIEAAPPWKPSTIDTSMGPPTLMHGGKRKSSPTRSYADSGCGSASIRSCNDGRNFHHSEVLSSRLSRSVSPLATENPPEEPEMVSQSKVTPTESSAKRHRPRLQCEVCGERMKTHTSLNKHRARHLRPYQCDIKGCARIGGFTTANDLSRHQKSVHHINVPGATVYKCFAPGCAKAEKIWPRLDNFKAHLTRIHPEQDVEGLLQSAEVWHRLEHSKILDDRKKSSIDGNSLVGWHQRTMSPLLHDIEPDIFPVEQISKTSLAMNQGYDSAYSSWDIADVPRFGRHFFDKLLHRNDNAVDSSSPQINAIDHQWEHDCTLPSIVVHPPTTSGTPTGCVSDHPLGHKLNQPDDDLPWPDDPETSLLSQACLISTESPKQYLSLSEAESLHHDPLIDHTIGVEPHAPRLPQEQPYEESVEPSMVTDMQLALGSLRPMAGSAIDLEDWHSPPPEDANDNPSQNSGSQSSSSQPSSTTKAEGHRRKRRRTKEDPVDGGDDSDTGGGTGGGKELSKPDATQQPRFFACPYFKRDPILFAACQGVRYMTLDALHRRHTSVYHVERGHLDQVRLGRIRQLRKQRTEEGRWRAIYSILFDIPVDEEYRIPDPYWLPTLSSCNIDDLVHIAELCTSADFGIEGRSEGSLSEPGIPTPFYRQLWRINALVNESRAYEIAQADRRWEIVRSQAIMRLITSSQESAALLDEMAGPSNTAQDTVDPNSRPNEFTANDQFWEVGPASRAAGEPSRSREQLSQATDMNLHGQATGPSQTTPSSSPQSLNLNDHDAGDLSQQTYSGAIPATFPAATLTFPSRQTSGDQLTDSPRDSGYESNPCPYPDPDNNDVCRTCGKNWLEHRFDGDGVDKQPWKTDGFFPAADAGQDI